MTADTRFLSIPEADTGKVAKAVVKLSGGLVGRIQRVRNMAPWQPDAALVYDRGCNPVVTISRMFIQEGDKYVPTDHYRITGERSRVAFDKITTEEVARVIREDKRSFIDRIRGLRR